MIAGVAAAYWGLYYSKKHAYKTNGMVFANCLCIYGFSRYLIELFSDDARIFGVLSWLAIWSLAMIVEGLIVRHIAKKHYQLP